MSKELEKLRTQIDAVDEQLMKILGERFRITREVGLYKRDHNLPEQNTQREAEQMVRIASLAKQYGVDPDFAQRLLRLVIDEVLVNHASLKAERDTNG